jgi:hypothetical protein
VITNNGITVVMTGIQQNIALFWDWLLFTNNIEITLATTLADLTEANWPGYVRQNNGSNIGPTLDDGVATSYPVTNPTFTNTDTAPYVFWGWAIVGRVDGLMLAGKNEGLNLIGPSAQVILLPTFTLQEQGESLKSPRPAVTKPGKKSPTTPIGKWR